MTTPNTPPATSSSPKRAQDYAAVRDWPGYFDLMLGKPARETLVAALANFDKEAAKGPSAPGAGMPSRVAVDLGCGEGRDAMELLTRGWNVHAIDAHPRALELLTSRVPEGAAPRYHPQIASFVDARWPDRVDLFNASFSLPFCEPRDFGALWGRITRSIRPGGRFAGQLFGPRDGWAILPDRTHHTRSELDSLFDEFVFEELREEERPDSTHDGRPKPWHVFHIVARKRIP